MYQKGLQLRVSRNKETEHQRKGRVIKRETRAHNTNSSASQPCLGPVGYRFTVVLAMLLVAALSLGPPGTFAGPEPPVKMEAHSTICPNI